MKSKAWSFSRLQTYERCPQQMKYQSIDKLPQPKAPALERGIATHTEIENYLQTTKRAKLPASLEHFKREARALKKGSAAGYVHIEMEIALTREWTPTTWFADDAWLRAKLDVVDLEDEAEPFVIDWKTGKVRGNPDQLELYGVALLHVLPKAQAVYGKLAFTDHGVKYPVENPFTVPRESLAFLTARWESRVEPLMEDTRFSPRPGPYCRWCAFSRAKGGPCDY